MLIISCAIFEALSLGVSRCADETFPSTTACQSFRAVSFFCEA
jgi:hypothetical protein